MNLAIRSGFLFLKARIGFRTGKAFFRHTLICVGLFLLTMTSPIEATTLPSLHHQLHIALNPDTHSITGVDRIQLSPQHRTDSSVSFLLHADLTIDRIELNGQSLFIPAHDTPATEHALPARRVVEIPLSAQQTIDQMSVLTLAYHGVIDDTPKASGGLRFVRPDDTTGHIGPDGVYLTYETFWYPTWEKTLATFDLTLDLPSDWEGVSQGRKVGHSDREGRRVSQWVIEMPSEALTMAANQFRVQHQTWNGIELATYLFPEEAHLAPQYLEATIKYLKLYTELLGPYPFPKFAVVENFFPSGLGLPSFTLLGQGVVRRGYTQPYSLGHEIVHSWFGNSVFNDFAQGNWVEGLTTYLANYYYDEATGHQQEAYTTRRRMIHEYNLYAFPAADYPVRSFHHKTTRIDNAIGYQKSALTFHMLRREIGDGAFFNGVRRLIQEGTGTYLEWKDLVRIFSKAADRDLGWFFQQWIDRTGAPRVHLENILVKHESVRHPPFTMTGHIVQTDPTFRFSLPVHVELEGGLAFDTNLTIEDSLQPFTLHLTAKPTKVSIDPMHHLLLNIPRADLPPMLNKWETDTHRILIRPINFPTDQEDAFTSLVQRLEGESGIDIINSDDPVISEKASYLIIGSAARRLIHEGAFQFCGHHVENGNDRLRIEDQTFEGRDMAFLITCPHPADTSHTVTFFFGYSPEAVTPISRLLFFYGWDSYLAFKQGKVIARGMFQPVHSAHEIFLPTP